MPKATGQNISHLARNRPSILANALGNAIQYLGEFQIKKDDPETRWLEAFSDPGKVTCNLMKCHKKTWSIGGVSNTEYTEIVKHVKKFIEKPLDNYSELYDRVTNLAENIGQKASPGSKVHLSWASKIALNAWPHAPVFIWDSSARLSLNTRLDLTLKEKRIKMIMATISFAKFAQTILKRCALVTHFNPALAI